MKLILKADRLIDGSSAKVMPHAAVVIEGDTISKVCSQSELTETELNDARVIDSSNGTLMPGFIEMHFQKGHPLVKVFPSGQKVQQ